MSLLAAKPYWNVEMLTTVVRFIDKRRSKYRVATISTRARTRSVQCGSDQKPSFSRATVIAAIRSFIALICSQRATSSSVVVEVAGVGVGVDVDAMACAGFLQSRLR